MKRLVFVFLLAITGSAFSQILVKPASETEFKEAEAIAKRIDDPVRRIYEQVDIIYKLGPYLKEGDVTVAEYRTLLEFRQKAYADMDVSRCPKTIQEAFEDHEHAINAFLKFLGGVSDGTAAVRDLVLGDSSSNETFDDYQIKFKRTADTLKAVVKDARHEDKSPDDGYWAINQEIIKYENKILRGRE